jgi:3-deoxy-D-manno-octulosonic-acid transferase
LKDFLCARRLFSGTYIFKESGLRVRTLYNILFTIFFVLSSPYYFIRLRRRGNWRLGFRERFGHYHAGLKQALTNRHVIWIHAVSVGEVNLCTQLIRAL